MPATAQQMKELVQVAREAVADFEEDDADLRRIAFERVLDHMLAGAPDDASASNGASEDDWPPRTKSRRAGLVGLYFGIDPERAAELFDLSDQIPRLQLTSSQVPKDAIQAIRAITLLVAGAGAAIGLETTVEDITTSTRAHRSMIPMDERRPISVSLVSNALEKMDEVAVLGEPGRANRIVRLKARGVEAAKECAAALAR